jgi:hypothetical protein
VPLRSRGISLARFGLSSRPKGFWLLGLSRGDFLHLMTYALSSTAIKTVAP